MHHVFARGNNRQLIYFDDADRGSYLAMLARAVASRQWRCLAFCLMDNHMHLLIETPLPNLAAGMQWLHGRFAEQFNARHGRSGHVFQGRYGSVLLETEAHLWTVVAYIARNPVTAGLCARPAAGPGAAIARSSVTRPCRGSTTSGCSRTTTPWAETRGGGTRRRLTVTPSTCEGRSSRSGSAAPTLSTTNS